MFKIADSTALRTATARRSSTRRSKPRRFPPSWPSSPRS